MSDRYTGREALRAIDQVLEELDRVRLDIQSRRDQVAEDADGYSMPGYWMSKAHSVLGNALALHRQVREWL